MKPTTRIHMRHNRTPTSEFQDGKCGIWNPSKLTSMPEKVTCNNCLRIMKHEQKGLIQMKTIKQRQINLLTQACGSMRAEIGGTDPRDWPQSEKECDEAEAAVRMVKKQQTVLRWLANGDSRGGAALLLLGEKPGEVEEDEPTPEADFPIKDVINGLASLLTALRPMEGGGEQFAGHGLAYLNQVAVPRAERALYKCQSWLADQTDEFKAKLAFSTPPEN